MNSYRKTAIVAGALFIICTAATLLSFPFSGPILADSDYLAKLPANESMVITGALIEFIWAAACAGIAIVLYPVLRRYSAALALGSVGFRVVEGVFVLVGTLSLLALLTLSQELVTAGSQAAVSLQTSGTLLLSIRDWAHNVVATLAFSLGAFMYYVLFYKSRLIPRWLSGWGLIGALLALAATVMASFTHNFDTASLNTYLNIPIGLNELVLALWLIVKGFSPAANTTAPVEA